LALPLTLLLRRQNAKLDKQTNYKQHNLEMISGHAVIGQPNKLRR